MTVLDTSIPYEKVLMIMARKTIRKEIELNPEFHYVEFDESLKEAWCKLQTQVCLFENIDEARKKWMSWSGCWDYKRKDGRFENSGL